MHFKIALIVVFSFGLALELNAADHLGCVYGCKIISGIQLNIYKGAPDLIIENSTFSIFKIRIEKEYAHRNINKKLSITTRVINGVIPNKRIVKKPNSSIVVNISIIEKDKSLLVFSETISPYSIENDKIICVSEKLESCVSRMISVVQGRITSNILFPLVWPEPVVD